MHVGACAVLISLRACMLVPVAHHTVSDLPVHMHSGAGSVLISLCVRMLVLAVTTTRHTVCR
jgi:hypothetical protein